MAKRSEEGMTLVELAVAMSILMIQIHGVFLLALLRGQRVHDEFVRLIEISRHGAQCHARRERRIFALRIL